MALVVLVDGVVMGKSSTVVDASFCNCSYLCFGIRINSVAITQVTFILGSIDLIITKINATSFSISAFLTLAPVALLVNCLMTFFFLCNFFLSFSLTTIFPNQMFIKTSQMAFSCDLVIVEINAHACFLSLVANSSRKASCVFTKRPIVNE